MRVEKKRGGRQIVERTGRKESREEGRGGRGGKEGGSGRKETSKDANK